MTERSPKKPANPPAARKRWVAPRVDRIDAGQAEIGTRATGDGSFTTS